jgi:formaldehyde-activating enzyme involved in methanogenesis
MMMTRMMTLFVVLGNKQSPAQHTFAQTLTRQTRKRLPVTDTDVAQVSSQMLALIINQRGI